MTNRYSIFLTLFLIVTSFWFCSKKQEKQIPDLTHPAHEQTKRIVFSQISSKILEEGGEN